MTATAFLAAQACGSAGHVPAPTSLADAIDRLRAAPRPDRAAVEQAFSARLARSDGAGAFASFAAEGVRVGDTVVTLDWREPVAGQGATAGPLLNVRVTKGCLARGEIERRYRPLEIAGIPRGRSLDETTTVHRDEPWGGLSFGFAERAPDCLAVVTFTVRA